RLFAIDHASVEPDLITIAKSMAGGIPLSGVIGKAQIMDSPAPGGLGGTYAGSPLGCAAGLAVLEVMQREGLLERANVVGARLMDGLKALQSKCDGVGEVRGIGAMVAMELVKNRDASRPDPELTRALTQAAGRNGLVLLSCGLRGNVIRFLPPLTIPFEVLDEGLATLERSLGELS